MLTSLGRRVAIIIASALFTAAAAVQTASVNMDMMYAGRFFGGMAIGMVSTIVPMYISECAPEHFRGQLSTMWQLAVTVGIVIAGALNIPLATWEEGWRISYGGNIVFSLALLILMTFSMPESPRWLVANGKTDQATKVLNRLRFPFEVPLEIEEIQSKVDEEKANGKGSWLDLFRNDNRMCYRTLLGAGLQLFQQLSGINAIMFFAPAMFSRFFSTEAALYGTLAINVVNHFATYITFGTVDRFGRVALMVSSGAGMVVSHIIVGSLATMEETQQVGIAIIAFSCFFVIFFCLRLGPCHVDSLQ